MDTVAVYYEKPIRTYGLEAKNGYTLVHLNCPTRLFDRIKQLFGLSCSHPLSFYCVTSSGEKIRSVWNYVCPAIKASVWTRP